MSIIYKNTDLARWGTGKGSRLTSLEVDENFWEVVQRLVALESDEGTAPTISFFEVIGATFYVHMSDSTILGPYALPVATFTFRGPWQANAAYAAWDFFTANGGLYVVLVPHVSASTFDAGANDGSGHDFYGLVFQAPGSALPTGGAVGQVNTKSSTEDFATTWSWKFPSGSGKTGKFLQQASNTQDDVAWVEPDASAIGFVPVTGSHLTASNVADAIEQAADLGGPASGITYTPATGSGLTSDNVEDALNELGDKVKLGRQTIWIPASAMTPLLTNGPSVGTVETTTNKNVIQTLDFDKDTEERAQFTVAMPKSWDLGNLSAKLFWSNSTASVSLDVVWGIAAVAVAIDGDSQDVATQPGPSITHTGNTSGDLLSITAESATFTVVDGSSNPVEAGAMIIFHVYRDATATADNLGVDARLQGLQLYYNVNAPTDA